jgi:20S proteasome alpha/beta subunit
MTVCIAAISEFNQIVTASDMKVSVGHTSSDVVMLKIQPLSDRWHVMISGKISQTYPLVEAMKERVRKIPQPSVKDMRKIVSDEYAAYGRQLATDKVLSPYGLSMAEFMQKRNDLGDLVFQQLMGEIARVQVGCDLIVLGHDQLSTPRILVVSNPTEDHPSFVTDMPHFAAIGSGGYLADTVLHYFQHYSGETIPETIYQVASAKFMAESAQDVGKVSIVSVIDSKKEMTVLDHEFIDKKLRSVWKRRWHARSSPRAIAMIDEKWNGLTKLSASQKSAGQR